MNFFLHLPVILHAEAHDKGMGVQPRARTTGLTTSAIADKRWETNCFSCCILFWRFCRTIETNEEPKRPLFILCIRGGRLYVELAPFRRHCRQPTLLHFRKKESASGGGRAVTNTTANMTPDTLASFK